ncbi:MAG: phage capsid protein [Tagaea sp.]|nr:phage capsid protein [Tagaea sp.]
MSQTIEQAFVRQYEDEVHAAYQRMGTKLRGTVRTKSSIVGKSTTFQKVGKGSAVTKARHAQITPMNVDHSSVECNLVDYYAGDWVDELDQLKTNIDEKAVVVNAGAYALGRKTDELIITALSGATITVGDYSTGLTRKLVLDALEALNSRDVPNDGQRFAAVSSHAWGELLRLDEFSRSEFVGTDGQPWKEGQMYKRWLNINWMEHSGLPLAAGDDRDSFLYHKTAIGHGSGQDVKSDITWHGDHASWWVNNMMSQGAALIDATGIVKLRLDDDAVYS